MTITSTSGRAENMSWQGIRITFGCGHMELRDKPDPDTEMEHRWAIGGIGACYVCPERQRVAGGTVAAVRQIVNVEDVTSPRELETLDSIHWHREGEGC